MAKFTFHWGIKEKKKDIQIFNSDEETEKKRQKRIYRTRDMNFFTRAYSKQTKKERKKQTETNESEKKYARVCVKGKFEY